MGALLIIGHGSLRPGSEAAMIRLAARLRERRSAPLVAAGFLNYSRPTLAEAFGRLLERGATAVTMLPYFLIAGHFTQQALPQALDLLRAAYPRLPIDQAAPLSAHAALAALVAQRVVRLCEKSKTPLPVVKFRALIYYILGLCWLFIQSVVAAGAGPQSAVLLAAHGSPDPAANAPIHAVAAMVATRYALSKVATCSLGLNAPAISTAIDAQLAAGYREMMVVPYLPQIGGHATNDMPAQIAAARERYPGVSLSLAAYLGYDPLLSDVLHDRAH